MKTQKIYSFTASNRLALILALIGLLLIVYGVYQFMNFENSKKEKLDTVLVQKEKSEDIEKKTEEVEAEVLGAVINPGKYRLNSSSMMVDLIASAGGLAEDADRDWVALNIKLNDPVDNNTIIYIVREGEQILEGVSTSGASLSQE